VQVYQLLNSYLVKYIAVYRAFRSFCTFSLYSRSTSTFNVLASWI